MFVRCINSYPTHFTHGPRCEHAAPGIAGPAAAARGAQSVFSIGCSDARTVRRACAVHQRHLSATSEPRDHGDGEPNTIHKDHGPCCAVSHASSRSFQHASSTPSALIVTHLIPRRTTRTTRSFPIALTLSSSCTAGASLRSQRAQRAPRNRVRPYAVRRNASHRAMQNAGSGRRTAPL